MSESLRAWMEDKIKTLSHHADDPDVGESSRSRMLAQARAYRTALDMAEVLV